MQRMYVHEVVLREDESTGAFKTTAATHKEAEPQGAPLGALFSFIQNLRNVKASKVVDENGEPLVATILKMHLKSTHKLISNLGLIKKYC